MSNRNGFTLLGVLIGGTILIIAVFASLRLLMYSRQQQLAYRDELQAVARANELIEFFRSLTSNQLIDYLRVNPVTGSTQKSNLYPLCSHINLLHRPSGTLLQGDPLAALPEGSMGEGGMFQANRFYQVRLVDLADLNNATVDACDKSPAAFTDGEIASNLIPSSTNKIRFMVTVVVTWIPPGKTLADLKRVSVSTVLPEASANWQPGVPLQLHSQILRGKSSDGQLTGPAAACPSGRVVNLETAETRSLSALWSNSCSLIDTGTGANATATTSSAACRGTSTWPSSSSVIPVCHCAWSCKSS